MERAWGLDREARMAEQMGEGRGIDYYSGLSLRGSLRSKLAPLLGILACARQLLGNREARGQHNKQWAGAL